MDYLYSTNSHLDSEALFKSEFFSWLSLLCQKPSVQNLSLTWIQANSSSPHIRTPGFAFCKKETDVLFPGQISLHCSCPMIGLEVCTVYVCRQGMASPDLLEDESLWLIVNSLTHPLTPSPLYSWLTHSLPHPRMEALAWARLWSVFVDVREHSTAADVMQNDWNQFFWTS